MTAPPSLNPGLEKSTQQVIFALPLASLTGAAVHLIRGTELPSPCTPIVSPRWANRRRHRRPRRPPIPHDVTKHPRPRLCGGSKGRRLAGHQPLHPRRRWSHWALSPKGEMGANAIAGWGPVTESRQDGPYHAAHSCGAESPDQLHLATLFSTG